MLDALVINGTVEAIGSRNKTLKGRTDVKIESSRMTSYSLPLGNVDPELNTSLIGYLSRRVVPK